MRITIVNHKDRVSQFRLYFVKLKRFAWKRCLRDL